MLTLSESTMQGLRSAAVKDGMEKIARALLECFPDRISDVEYARAYTENAYRNMKTFPIEDAELPHWTFLSVIIGDERFYEAPELQRYFSLEGREKVRLLFDTVNNFVSH